MNKIKTIDLILKISTEHKLTAREVIKSVMKIPDFIAATDEEIISLLNEKYEKTKTK